jgi:hypothetical protein
MELGSVKLPVTSTFDTRIEKTFYSVEFLDHCVVIATSSLCHFLLLSLAFMPIPFCHNVNSILVRLIIIYTHDFLPAHVPTMCGSILSQPAQ